MMIILTAGSAFVMWLGERVTERGVGNGISIILLINIVSTMPERFQNLYTQFIKGKDPVRMCGLLIDCSNYNCCYTLVCMLQGAERKIPVQYAKKVQGKKTGRWTVIQYSAESKYCRRYSCNFCFIPDGDSVHYYEFVWRTGKRRWSEDSSGNEPVVLV